MSEWKKYKLGEIASVQTGPFGSQLHQSDYVEKGTPIITVEHLGENRILHENLPRITDEDKKRLNKYWLKEGDIVFSRVGSVDRRAYVKKTEDGWLFSGRCLRVRPKNVNGKYLSYFFGLDDFKKRIRAVAVGATMPSLNTSIMNNIEVQLPENISTQTAIAQILTSLDDKIELNLQMNQTFETMAQALFKQWFVDFKFPDFNGELENDLPIGWRKAQIKEICEVNSSTLSSKEKIDEIHYVEISEVDKGIIKEIKIFKRGEEPSRARRKLKHGDTVLSTVRPNRGSYFLSLYPTENLIASTGFAVFTPTSVPFSFLYLFLTNEEQLEFYGKMADGAAYPAINPSVIMNLEINLPSNEILEMFHNITGNLFIKAFNNFAENKILSETRDTLLPKLMSGKLELV